MFQDKYEHLELLDGVLIDLLKTKWNTFGKNRFYKQFFCFTIYFIISLLTFILRPGPETEPDLPQNRTIIFQNQTFAEPELFINYNGNYLIMIKNVLYNRTKMNKVKILYSHKILQKSYICSFTHKSLI